MHRGDGDAAFRLLQRRRALRGIQKLGWRWRLAMANAARKRNHEELLAAKAAATERRRIEEDCTVTSPKALAALRARYGMGSCVVTMPKVSADRLLRVESGPCVRGDGVIRSRM
jgi:predicted GNAT family N-acyltransferase